MNLLDLLKEYQVPLAPEGHHHVSYGWIGLDCPSCSPHSGRFRLGASLTGIYFSCWSCGYLPLLSTLSEITGASQWELRNKLDGLEKSSLQEPKKRGKLVLPLGLAPLLPQHRTYLQKRGFDPDELAALWGLQGLGIAPKLSWRIFIPVSEQGQVCSWTTRSSSESVHKRYINAKPSEESVSLKELLLGEDKCQHGILVTEGPLDAMAIGPGAVCTFGLAYSKTQVLKVSRFPVRCIVFDREEAAQRRALKLCRLLSDFPGITCNVLLGSGKDPAECSEHEIKELRKRFLD